MKKRRLSDNINGAVRKHVIIVQQCSPNFCIVLEYAFFWAADDFSHLSLFYNQVHQGLNKLGPVLSCPVVSCTDKLLPTVQL